MKFCGLIFARDQTIDQVIARFLFKYEKLSNRIGFFFAKVPGYIGH